MSPGHYTHYKFIDYVLIPKPYLSSREGKNSHCRRSDLLIYAVLDQSVAAKYDRSYVTSVAGSFITTDHSCQHGLKKMRDVLLISLAFTLHLPHQHLEEPELDGCPLRPKC